MAQKEESAGSGGAPTIALLDTLLHTAPVGLGFVDAELRFVRINEVLAAMNGAPVADHLGRPVHEVLNPDLAATVTPILQRTLETASPSGDIEVANEGRRWVISYYPVHEEGDDRPVGVGVVVRDVTEQHLASEELDARARHLETVAQLGQRALIADDFTDLLREGIEMLGDVLGIDVVYVMEHDRPAGEFVLRLARGFDAEPGARIKDKPNLQSGYALHNRMPIFIPSVPDETRFEINPLLRPLNVKSILTVVIRGPGVPYGVLGVATYEPVEFSQAEVDFVQSMANVLGTAAARAKIDAALHRQRERLQLALDAGGMGDWEWDMVADRVSWSESLYRIFGIDEGDFGGSFGSYEELVHPDDRQKVRDMLDAAIEGQGDSIYVEHRINKPDGGVRWIEVNGHIRRDSDGTPFGMIGVAADVTERVEAEYKQSLLLAAEQEARAEAEATRDKLEFLAEASQILSGSLDYKATLHQVAYLVVPRLADWCAVDVIEDEGLAPTTVVVAHVDPDKIALARALREKYPPDPEAEAGVHGVIRSGQPLIYPDVTDEMLAASAKDDEHLQTLRDLQLRSALVVPLLARGRAFGAITMIGAESGRTYTDDDLRLAMDLARRAAVAIDNARLYEERSRVAEALQRSLLPPSRPEIPGVEVAVRYRPVGQGAEIGGDFYDVFETREGTWAVVIGDVCGKGTAAAALTGLARDTIRGVSIRERAPRRVLRILNEVVLRREDADSRFLTVALGMLEVDEDVVRLRISCGGHPLPLVVRANGEVEEAGTPALLLGLFPEVDPVDVHLELHRGDALVLYTDGVLEAQGPEGLFGELRLRGLLAAAAPADAEGLAQAVLDAVNEFQPGPPQDDMAVVVLRMPPA